MLKALPFQGKFEQDSFQRNDFTYGVAMYQHGFHGASCVGFQQVIASKPEDADAYYNLGTLRLGAKRLCTGSSISRTNFAVKAQLS